MKQFPFTSVLVKRSPDLEWPADESTFYIMSRDGLFICRNHELFRSCAPARSCPDELAGQREVLEPLTLPIQNVAEAGAAAFRAKDALGREDLAITKPGGYCRVAPGSNDHPCSWATRILTGSLGVSHNLSSVFERLCQRQRSSLQTLGKRLTLEILHDEVGAAGLASDVE